MKNVNSIKMLLGAALRNKSGEVEVAWAPWNAVGSHVRSRRAWAERGSVPEKLAELAEGLLSIRDRYGQPFWVTVTVGSQTVFDGLGCAA